MSYILIAEDDRDLLLLVQRKLELSGYENVWMTHNGEEGLKHALESPPRLMILDIMLPGMDGLTVCSEVKDKLGENAPQVIIISARGQRTHVKEGEDAGADAYIIKPFSPRDLVAKIDELLGEGFS
jgi:DNA-binding response OmpR family regulator